MINIVYYVASSIDSYIATSDGSVEWLTRFESAGDDYGYREFYESVDAVLLGRRTYEHALTFGEWPYPDKPCWVFAHRPVSVSQPNVTVTGDSPLQVVRHLKARGLNRAWLVGGGYLAGAFHEHNLITEYVVSVLPVILGSGVPLFSGTGVMRDLELIESRAYPNGLLQARYRLTSQSEPE